jgi:hypothetical protein
VHPAVWYIERRTTTPEDPVKREDRIPAWRPLIAVAERVCESAEVRLSWKTVHEDLILMTAGPASRELLALLDLIEQVANAIDPMTGVPRDPEEPRVPDADTFDALFAGNSKSAQTILNHYLPRADRESGDQG